MTLVHDDSATGRSILGWPDRLSRMFGFDGDHEWLRVEEFHDGDTLVVRAELPDIDPAKDVEVAVGGGTVRIRAHREEKSDKKQKRGYRSEFRYGEFEREISVPEGTSPENVKATYSKGVLEVRIPCSEKAEPSKTKVPVTVS